MTLITNLFFLYSFILDNTALFIFYCHPKWLFLSLLLSVLDWEFHDLIAACFRFSMLKVGLRIEPVAASRLMTFHLCFLGLALLALTAAVPSDRNEQAQDWRADKRKDNDGLPIVSLFLEWCKLGVVNVLISVFIRFNADFLVHDLVVCF